MISVDNFYYVLYKNLLEPSRFNIFYFYPFGSTSKNNLYSIQNQYWEQNTNNSNVLFYDQEPLLKEHLPTHFDIRFCQILANSEKSLLKNSLLKKENFIDWYYFYHGFAALDWFRDFKYFPKVEYQFSKVFISLNRLHTNYRSYRLTLVNEYIEKNLLDHGYVSLITNNNEQGSWLQELDSPHTLITQTKVNSIRANFKKINLPLTVDLIDPPGWASAHSGESAIKLNQSALWHIVSETIFYHDKLHLTEKIFKPIVSKRPFILIGAKNNLKYLKSYGFQTFDQYIEEDYDSEPDPDKRITMAISQLEKLCKLNQKELKEMHRDMQNILIHNYQHFFNEFKKIIVDEMLDNFQECLKIWNHDRLYINRIMLENNTIRDLKNLFLR